MARQPSYPRDAAVGDSARDGEDDRDDKGGEGSRRKKQLMTGAAIGIGSAAIVAALLYAKKRKSDR